MSVMWERRCTAGCGQWHEPWAMVTTVFGHEECVECATHAAYVFPQVCEHYGDEPVPADGAYIPEELYDVYFPTPVQAYG